MLHAAVAQEGSKTTVETKKTTVVTETRGTTSWGGFGWGLGLATSFDVGGARTVNATIINNMVRVTDSSSNVGVGFVLEAHYFLREYLFSFGNGTCSATRRDILNCTELAHGPFIALEVGGGNSATPAANGPISAFAMGWMVGMRHPSYTATPNSSWNFGVGLRIDPKAQILGDGIFANQPLPAGETAVRYKTVPRFGLMLLSSFSF
jgi:hypothetical protein